MAISIDYRHPTQSWPIRHRRGSSVNSATLVLFLLTVAASWTAPQLLQQREQRTAMQAIDYLTNVHKAQEKYRSAHGQYCDDLAELDLEYVAPAYFDVGEISVAAGQTFEKSWSLTLRRYEIQALFGAYAITCTQDGFAQFGGQLGPKPIAR